MPIQQQSVESISLFVRQNLLIQFFVLFEQTAHDKHDVLTDDRVFASH